MSVVEIIKQAIKDFTDIKNALIYIGLDVEDLPTSQYADKIKTLKATEE